MRRAFVSAVVQAVSTLLVVAAPAAASVDITLIGRSGTATADFVSTDSTGCVTTSVHVEAGNDFVFQNPPKQPVPLPPFATVFILLSRVNACTGESFDRFGGNQGAIDFSWDHRLNQATVR